MTVTAATLVLTARGDSALYQALVNQPEQVARERNLPALVTRAAALVLRNPTTAQRGIWF